MPLVVALALDGDPLSGRALCDQVDPDVTSVEPCQRFALGPIGPAPDFYDLEFRLLQRDAHEELFEPPSFLRLVPAFVADSGEHFAGARASSQVEVHLWCWHGRGHLRSGLPWPADSTQVVLILRPDDCNGNVRLVIKDVVGALGLSACHQLATHDDAALGEAYLLAYLQRLIPIPPGAGRV